MSAVKSCDLDSGGQHGSGVSQRRRLVVLSLFLAALLGFQNDVFAFNCNEAKNKIEKWICTDGGILEQDRLLQLRYKEVLATADAVTEIRATQRKWLEARNACSDKTCVEKEYRARLAELEKISIQAKSWIAPNKFTQMLCAGVAAELADNRLQVLFSTATPSSTPVTIDVNGDGMEETAFIEETSIYIQQNKSQPSINYVPTEQDYDSNAFSGNQASLIKAGGSIYLLHSDADMPSLYFYGPRLEERLVCVFNKSRGYAVLTPYEILKGMADKDPLQFAIEHLDITAVKILHEHGHDLNKKPEINVGSYLAFAVSQVDMFYANHRDMQDNGKGKGFIEELLNLGAVSGAVKDDDKYMQPLADALRFNRADIADLLLTRDSSVYRNASTDVLESFKDKSNRDNLLLKIAKRRGDIDNTTVLYAVQPGNMDFLRALVATGLPLHGYYVIWFNGNKVDLLEPLTNGKVRALDNSKEVFALLQKLHKKIPEKGQEVGFRFAYETDKKVVLMTSVSGSAYSAEHEQELVNFSTSVCMHLIGGNCGSQAMQAGAVKWLDNLPMTCTKELSRKFDAPTCKLAMYWVALKNLPIFMKNKQSPDEPVNNSIPAIKAFSDLGTKSLQSFFGRILAH